MMMVTANMIEDTIPTNRATQEEEVTTTATSTTISSNSGIRLSRVPASATANAVSSSSSSDDEEDHHHRNLEDDHDESEDNHPSNKLVKKKKKKKRSKSADRCPATTSTTATTSMLSTSSHLTYSSKLVSSCTTKAASTTAAPTTTLKKKKKPKPTVPNEMVAAVLSSSTPPSQQRQRQRQDETPDTTTATTQVTNISLDEHLEITNDNKIIMNGTIATEPLSPGTSASSEKKFLPLIDHSSRPKMDSLVHNTNSVKSSLGATGGGTSSSSRRQRRRSKILSRTIESTSPIKTIQNDKPSKKEQQQQRNEEDDEDEEETVHLSTGAVRRPSGLREFSKLRLSSDGNHHRHHRHNQNQKARDRERNPIVNGIEKEPETKKGGLTKDAEKRNDDVKQKKKSQSIVTTTTTSEAKSKNRHHHHHHHHDGSIKNKQQQLQDDDHDQSQQKEKQGRLEGDFDNKKTTMDVLPLAPHKQKGVAHFGVGQDDFVNNSKVVDSNTTTTPQRMVDIIPTMVSYASHQCCSSSCMDSTITISEATLEDDEFLSDNDYEEDLNHYQPRSPLETTFDLAPKSPLEQIRQQQKDNVPLSSAALLAPSVARSTSPVPPAPNTGASGLSPPGPAAWEIHDRYPKKQIILSEKDSRPVMPSRKISENMSVKDLNEANIQAHFTAVLDENGKRLSRKALAQRRKGEKRSSLIPVVPERQRSISEEEMDINDDDDHDDSDDDDKDNKNKLHGPNVAIQTPSTDEDDPKSCSQDECTKETTSDTKQSKGRSRSNPPIARPTRSRPTMRRQRSSTDLKKAATTRTTTVETDAQNNLQLPPAFVELHKAFAREDGIKQKQQQQNIPSCTHRRSRKDNLLSQHSRSSVERFEASMPRRNSKGPISQDCLPMSPRRIRVKRGSISEDKAPISPRRTKPKKEGVAIDNKLLEAFCDSSIGSNKEGPKKEKARDSVALSNISTLPRKKGKKESSQQEQEQGTKLLLLPKPNSTDVPSTKKSKKGHRLPKSKSSSDESDISSLCSDDISVALSLSSQSTSGSKKSGASKSNSKRPRTEEQTKSRQGRSKSSGPRRTKSSSSSSSGRSNSTGRQRWEADSLPQAIPKGGTPTTLAAWQLREQMKLGGKSIRKMKAAKGKSLNGSMHGKGCDDDDERDEDSYLPPAFRTICKPTSPPGISGLNNSSSLAARKDAPRRPKR